MAGLQAIHLHNSIFQGKRVSLNCDGHTNLTGGNGAGKTSILRLIPIFYGFEPNRLIDRAANKKNFTDFYLPNNQSMIVFEYTRARGKTCCAVLFRRGSDSGFAYRLIKGSAIETLFHPELAHLYDDKADVDTIIHSLPRLLDVKASNIIGQINDYRAIIQNDFSSGRNRKISAGVRSLASEYSLVSSSKMQHIQSLTTVSLSKNQHISRLKAMIVDSMLSAEIDVGTPPTNDKNTDVWQELDSLNAFLANEAVINAALDDFAQLQGYRGELVQSRQRILNLKKLGEGKVYKLRDEITAKEAELKEAERQFKNDDTKLNSKRGEHSGKLSIIRRELNDLKADKENYEQKQQILHWVDEHKRLSQTKRELEAAKQRLALHQAGNSEIIEEAKKRKEQISDDSRQQQEVLNRELEFVNNHIRDLSDKLYKDTNDLDTKFRQRRKTKEGESKALIDAATVDLADENMQANQAGMPTNEEANRIESAEQQVAKLKDSLKSAERTVSAKESEREIARRDNRTAEKNFEEGRARHSQTVQERDDLKNLLYPDDGTLLAFLRESGEGWEQSLGKAINPKLLERKDLRPQLAEAGATGMFGFELDLEQLPLPQEAESEAILEERVSRATRLANEARERLENLEDKWKAAQAKEAAKDNELKLARLDVAKQSNLVEQSEQELTAIRASINSAIESRRGEFAEKINQLTSRIKAAKRKASEELAELEAQYNHQRTRLEDDSNVKRAELQSQIERLERNREEIKSWEVSEHEKIESDKNKLLSEKGVDTETLKAIQGEISGLELRVDSASKKEADVLEYKYWRDNKWVRLGDLENDLDQEVKEIKRLDDELQKLKAEHEVEAKELTDKISAANKQQLELNRKIDQWVAAEKPALEAINSIPVDVGADSDEHLESVGMDQTVTLDIGDVITIRLTKLTDESETLLENISKALRDTERAINRNPGSDIYARWEHLRNDRSSISFSGKNDKASEMEAMLDLKHLMEHDIPETRLMLIQNIKATGRLVSNYYESLSGISNKVKNVSRRLENELNTNHGFDDLTNIKLRLNSKVEQFDYWPRLKSFANEWGGWEHSNDLPPYTLQQSLKELEGMFRLAQMDRNDLGSLVDLEISLMEKGRPVEIKRDADLSHASSEGLSAIAVLVIFAALTRYLCPDESVRIVWPIDELGRLHPVNIEKLFQMMTQRNIAILSAQPSASQESDKRYKYCYVLSADNGINLREFVNPENRPLRKMLEQGILQTRQEVAINE